MKSRRVVATFSDGTVKARGSVSKVYTHAYCFRYRSVAKFDYGTIKAGDVIGSERFGFSTSEAQCRANLNAESAYVRRQGYAVDLFEVVPVAIDGVTPETING